MLIMNWWLGTNEKWMLFSLYPPVLSLLLSSYRLRLIEKHGPGAGAQHSSPHIMGNVRDHLSVLPTAIVPYQVPP